MPSITSWFWGSSSKNGDDKKNGGPRESHPSDSSSVRSTTTSQEQEQLEFSPPSPTATTTKITATPSSSPSITPTTNPSSLPNNVKLLVGGIVFFALANLVTRRSLTRRQRASIPPFYTGSTYHRPRVNGALEALEALNIATINVLSISMIVVGGALCVFDINHLDDLQRLVRGRLGVDGTGRSEQEVEEQFEEWLATVLDRKAEKEKEKDNGKSSKRRKVIIIDEDDQDEVDEAWRNERGKRR